MTTWDEHVAAWSRPPVDDVGYLSSVDLRTLDDDSLSSMIAEMRRTRYTGWRNHGGLWREMMKLDDTHGKDVLDFGCGVGMEALELHNAGNRVSLADISGSNLALAMRVLFMADRSPESLDAYLVINDYPFIDANPESFDVIHCSGVLHHIPWAKNIMARFHDLLRPGGEVRLMVYSDIGWQIATGEKQPPLWTIPAREREGFDQFVRFMDGVGDYADFYTLDRLDQDFGRWFDVSEFAYLCEDRRYCAAVLTRKGC